MSDIRKEVTESLFSERENETKHPTYEKEIAFYTLICQGKLDKVRESWNREPKADASQRGVLSDDPVRNAMYHMVSMTSLVSRLCIARGMPQDVSYKLSDAFVKKADARNTVEGIHEVQWEMVMNYTLAMSNYATIQVSSKQIRECINYIRKNIHNNITIGELAEHVELNETYLSKLFKKEMGCTVSEFIRNEKIEEACWLLRYTDKTSIEIATDLSFSSHSYFISVFKKVKGITPKEYRNYSFEDVYKDMGIDEV